MYLFVHEIYDGDYENEYELKIMFVFTSNCSLVKTQSEPDLGEV